MKQIDKEYTTLQTLSTAVELSLAIAHVVMGKRNTDRYISKNGRTVLADQILTNIQTSFNKELGVAQHANQ